MIVVEDVLVDVVGCIHDSAVVGKQSFVIVGDVGGVDVVGCIHDSAVVGKHSVVVGSVVGGVDVVGLQDSVGKQSEVTRVVVVVVDGDGMHWEYQSL